VQKTSSYNGIGKQCSHNAKQGRKNSCNLSWFPKIGFAISYETGFLLCSQDNLSKEEMKQHHHSSQQQEIKNSGKQPALCHYKRNPKDASSNNRAYQGGERKNKRVIHTSLISLRNP